jgi:FtsZ-interacting cell division protein ZipA
MTSEILRNLLIIGLVLMVPLLLWEPLGKLLRGWRGGRNKRNPKRRSSSTTPTMPIGDPYDTNWSGLSAKQSDIDDEVLTHLKGMANDSRRVPDDVSPHPPLPSAPPITPITPITSKPAQSPPPAEPRPPARQKGLIIFWLLADEGEWLEGPQLVAALHERGLVHGEHGAFHAYLGDDDRPLFGVANAVEPSAFDPETFDRLQTPGIVFFAQIPGPTTAIDALQQMYATASNLVGQLGGRLCDQYQQPLDGEALYQQAVEFDRE